MGAYESSEYSRMFREIKEIESTPLSDRKEARKSFLEAMQESPEVVAERLSWLFNGSYGWAEQQKALEIVKNKRCNQLAGLNLMIAEEEWMCPRRLAASAYNSLSDSEKVRLNELIQKEIDEYKAEEIEA